MVFLILESLGSTELLFILAMALVFFGPRKLPQLSRSLGKNIAEFKRASEDFKRTWDKEVSLEETETPTALSNRAGLPEENSILGNAPNQAPNQAPNNAIGQPLQSPTIEAIAPERVIARHSMESIEVDRLHTSAESSSVSEQTDLNGRADEAEPSRKRDWL